MDWIVASVIFVVLTALMAATRRVGRRGGRQEPCPDEMRGDRDDETSEEENEPAQLPVDGVLDLHTFQPREVRALVDDYLDECQRLGIHEIRIIHGKGKGVLRRTVHSVLANRDDVASFELAPPERGGWGATVVTLHAGSKPGTG